MSQSSVTVSEVAGILEKFAPLALQESYDNCGLQLGSYDDVVSGILIGIDITEEILTEAIDRRCNMIVAHHPLIFGGLKKLTGKTAVERMVIRAIRHNIAIYIAHTNFDMVDRGVSHTMCQKLGLINCNILSPMTGKLLKLVTFVPHAHADEVKEAIFNAGAGHIGNYDCCSYQINGEGTFRGDEQSNPFVGQKGQIHKEPEMRIETILPEYLSTQVVEAMIAAHPYEEVAYDLYPLKNGWNTRGIGMIGELPEAANSMDFLKLIKKQFQCHSIRYTNAEDKTIRKVAVCGGSGSSLIREAMNAGADIFITGDIKYHQFFDAENRMIIADIGHFESEQFTKELFFELLTKKLPNFAIHLSNINSNPINYL